MKPISQASIAGARAATWVSSDPYQLVRSLISGLASFNYSTVTIMMAGSHLAIGVAAWVWVAPHLGLPAFDPLPLALAGIGSLLPDIDHPQSWVGLRLRMISRPLAAMIGHRGITHSLLAGIACGFLLRWNGVSRMAVDAVVVGYLSHLAADLLTSGGLRLMWPSRARFAIPLCKTGSLTELIIVVGVVTWVGADAVGWPAIPGF